LAGTDDASNPFFDPEGQWIGFFANGKLKKVSVAGGLAQTLCDAPGGRGGTWGQDGTIVFTPNSTPVSLMRVSSAGGKAEPQTTLAHDETLQRWPELLPENKALLYTSLTSLLNGFSDANLVVQPFPSGEPKVLVRGGFYGRYVSSGHLVYIHDGTLFAAPFD